MDYHERQSKGEVKSEKSEPQPAKPEPEYPKMEQFCGLLRYERQSVVRQISYYISGNILEAHYYTDLYTRCAPPAKPT